MSWGGFGNSLELPLSPTHLCKEASSHFRALTADSCSVLMHLLSAESSLSITSVDLWAEGKVPLPYSNLPGPCALCAPPAALWTGVCPLVKSASSCCSEGRDVLEAGCQEVSLPNWIPERKELYFGQPTGALTLAEKHLLRAP